MSVRENFTFTSSQKKGIFAFIILLLVVIGGTVSLDFFQIPEAVNLNLNEPRFASPVYEKTSSTRLDINLADSSQLVELSGIGPVLAARIINYRNSRGGFNSINEIARVYGLSAEVFNKISPSLFVNAVTSPANTTHIANTKTYHKKSFQPEIPLVLDINIATANDFERLPGIGKVLSKRIVKYRNSIKGFESVSELSRVYKLPPEVIKENKEYLMVNDRTLADLRDIQVPRSIEKTDFFASNQKTGELEVLDGKGNRRGQASKTTLKDLIIDINTVDSATLVLLPEIGKTRSQRIIRYRKAIGFYRTLDDLEEVYGISPEILARIKPFLTIEPVSNFPLIDLNTASRTKIRKYPGIDLNTAISIIYQRDKLGRFDNWEEVAEVEAVTPEILEILKSYFKL